MKLLSVTISVNRFLAELLNGIQCFQEICKQDELKTVLIEVSSTIQKVFLLLLIIRLLANKRR